MPVNLNLETIIMEWEKIVYIVNFNLEIYLTIAIFHKPVSLFHKLTNCETLTI